MAKYSSGSFSDKTNRLKSFYCGLTKKQKGVFLSVCVAVALIIIGGISMALKPEKAMEVSSVEVSKQNIQQTLTVSGTVASSSQSVYNACNGVTVKQVSVKVGDCVEVGQQMAAFDVAPLAGKVEEKQQAFTQSKKTYEDSILQAENARKQLPEIEKRIAELQGEINGSAQSSGGEQSLVDSILSKLSIDAISDMLSKLTEGFSMSSILGSSLSDSESELLELQAKKLVLESQASNTMLSVYESLMNNTEKEYEAYKEAYAKLAAGWKATEAGIVTSVNITEGQPFSLSDAQNNSSVDISQVMSQLQSGVDVSGLLAMPSDLAPGIVVDNFSGYKVKFNINQYDISKITLGQKASVTVVNNPTKYSGNVSFISATMSSDSGGFDISSIASSLTGGAASGGLDAEVSVENPDKNMVIGMTVDMEIMTSNANDVVAVPIEAIYLDGKDVYVYVIEKKKVRKQLLEVGISSNTMYEVKSGCEVGDVLVKNPTSALTDGARVRLKKSTDKV